MITLLSKLFIKNREDLQAPKTRQAYGILCGATGIFLNLCLFGGKFIAGHISGSIAITADAFNNLSDAGSSIITLIGFKMAGQKPNPQHPFGHGRIEYISGLLVSVLILLMGLELLAASFSKILHPEAPDVSPVILLILPASILVKGYMYLYNRRLGKELDASAMLAAAADSLSDMLATSAVLISTLISRFTGLAADGWCGILVGLFICWAGYHAAKDTISPLLGQAADPEFVRQIHDLVLAHEGVLGVHDLIVHNYGPGRILISLHAEVPADGCLLELHEKIDAIEHELKEKLYCHAVIHMDPVCIDDEKTARLKAAAEYCLHEINETLTLHDFRIVDGPTHTNMIFDVVTPYDFPLSDQALTELIQEKIKKSHPNCSAVIEIDKQM